MTQFYFTNTEQTFHTFHAERVLGIPIEIFSGKPGQCVVTSIALLLQCKLLFIWRQIQWR